MPPVSAPSPTIATTCESSWVRALARASPCAIARFENPAQMGQRIAQDYQRWGQIIRDKGISPE